MIFNKRILLILFFVSFGLSNSFCQVNSVTFGKNRIQYKKFKWQFYQTENFNVYFYDNGQELAKYVLQVAEKELPQLEMAAEYSLQRRANIIIFNEYADYQQTNIGLDADIVSTGGTTKLVNNKLLVYFNGDHAHLKKQIREGIASVLTKNILFGDDFSEIASNQTILDLPTWFTDGYEAYLGENWNTDLDDELRSDMLSGDYSKFNKYVYKKPQLAGHAFWFFIEEKYKKENVTYFFYLSRVLKSMNKASLQIAGKPIKELYTEFMEYQEEKYSKDIAKRKAYPKGNFIEGFDISPRLNYYRFNVNPNKKNNSYVVTRFKNGMISVILNNDFENKTLLKFGDRSLENEMNPIYPVMAWDPKGNKIAVVYSLKGKINLFVYDVEKDYSPYKLDLTDQFDQIQDMNFMIDSRTLLFSAVRNGHTDIYSYDLEKEKATQINNDVYDDINPTFVTFPGKMGILFASNRPSANAKNGDTILPSNHRYNIFLITNFGDKPELNQITQLTNLQYGNAKFPSQFNDNHFTFVSDENGIANRYAGFFTTKNMGIDTLVLIGEDILRNPNQKEIDSSLKAQKKLGIDSIAYVSITEDSAYSFPITNYPSNLYETRTAGDNRIVSEVTSESDQKSLYKLKIDENLLKRRNITATPTSYGKMLMRAQKSSEDPSPEKTKLIDSLQNIAEQFQTEFNDEKKITSLSTSDQEYSVLKNAKLFRYKPIKFSADFGSLGFNNSILYNKYQKYENGSGPINVNSSSALNGLITLGASDVMEDIRLMGAFKIGSDFKDNEWLFSFQNLRRRVDWGLSFYRNVIRSYDTLMQDPTIYDYYPVKLITHIFQGNVSYPFSRTNSIRFASGIRTDVTSFISVDPLSASRDDKTSFFSVSHLEFIHDNSLNKAINIWHGDRYKFYLDWNQQLNSKEKAAQNMYNFGFDARYYYPIYKNFIWAGRAAGDFSWGNQKFIYYLGGTDGWLMFGNQSQFFNAGNPPTREDYAFQSLAVNMRGYIQNAAHGNNAIVLNSELRLPVWSTFVDQTINNSFISDFQLIQFIDFGAAWEGDVTDIKRPEYLYTSTTTGNVTVKQKTSGIGPFIGGYGFGVRSSLLGYFVKFDVSWPMNGFFNGQPINYFSLGLDF